MKFRMSKTGRFGRLAAVGVICALALGPVPAARGDVVFSEIQYNPVGGDTNEYVELYNTGSTTVNLHGAQFIAGITYTFTNVSLAPSSYVVVAKDRASFTNRYPSVTNVAPGSFGNNLSNGGEPVTLTNAAGTAYFSVSYDDEGGWPVWPDGQGASLQLREFAAANPSDPTNWCSSLQYNGTPGSAGDCWQAQILINELLTHADPPYEDAIEVYNASTGSVNLAGWYLSDDVAARKKYRITNAVPVAAGGYAVFYQVQFDTNGFFDTNNTPFALDSALGDTVFLTAADGASNLTFIADIQAVEASENGVSFGRFPNGTGSFTTLRSLTFGTTNPPTLTVFRTGEGAANSLPKIGPVVISEIMYNPASGAPEEEYIELLNVTTSAVPLYDPLHPSNTWRLMSAVNFTFPTNASIPAGGRILVATNVPAFRAAYGLDTNIPVYGSWSGQLDNAGESVRLYKPDPPQTNGFVPYVLVDRVDYGDDPPWPTAPDGNGPSLERTVNTNFGNVSENWFVGAPGGSPGAAPAGGFVNPQVRPPAPASGQILTVTVSVVAETLPTQVVLRTAADGVFSNRVMTDDGVLPDAVAADQVYSASFAGPANAWLYYQFLAYAGGDEAFVSPARETKFTAAPLLTLQDCYGGVATTVAPAEAWGDYSVTASVGFSNCFQLFLAGAGEALLDDVRMVDGGGSNHLVNSDFSSQLTTWFTNSGNHQTSSRENPFDEGTNYVLHVRATGPGNTTFFDTVSALIEPPITSGTTATLSFRARQVSSQIEHWYSLLVGSAPAEPVINEIMYHPAQTNEEFYEYVELYNPSAASVDLTDWQLDGVGDFVFPTGKTLSAGSFLVVCADTGAVTAFHGITNVIGNWTGRLQNDGETLTLFNSFGRTVDVVRYEDDTPWSVAADGAGPSLERRNPLATGNTSLNWSSSSADTNWQQVSFTTTVSVATSLVFFLDFDGMCWLDDVSAIPLGTNEFPDINGTFELGTNLWSFRNNHARSRVQPGQAHSGANALAVFGNETRLIFPDTLTGTEERYGDALSNHVRSATLGGGEYAVSWWARREGVGGSIYGVFGGSTNRIPLGLQGTPGRTNSIDSTNQPLEILSVSHTTNIAAVGFTNIVRVRVAPAGLVSNVTLSWRSFGTNDFVFTDRAYSNLAMLDNGVLPDTTAGDGEYAVYVPAATSNWRMVRYYVTAVASNGFTARNPHPDDPSLDYAFWVQSSVPQSFIPNWHVLSDGDPVVYPINTRACAVSPEGQVFTDVEFRHRGRQSSSTNGAMVTGVALRMHDGRLLNTRFAPDQEGINFRSRKNGFDSGYTRVVSEPIAYDLQKTLGLAAPRWRHVVVWINGDPSVTSEVEAPQEEFLSGNDLDGDDFVSRAGYTGRRPVGGDTSFDNFDSMTGVLYSAVGAAKNEAVRTNLWYEEVQHALAFLSAVGDGDQYFDWNMFQHRRSSDGRWGQHPWDLDICLDTNVLGVVQQTTNLHPYYRTPLHPDIFFTNYAQPLGGVLFYPETGAGSAYTTPYRHRQQATLWRLVHTVFTTNYLYPRLDAIQTSLVPVYAAVNAGDIALLTGKVAEAKGFVESRRNFLINGSWSDKNTSLWASVYAPTNVVINEIMHSPLSGGEYVELYNPGAQPIDLSGWQVGVADERYRLPFGTMLGPTSYLVLADTQPALTNAYAELGNGAAMVERYPGYKLWDWPIVFTSATEYASRVREVDALTLPGTGGTVQVLDVMTNVIDAVTYAIASPWPTNTGSSLELIHVSDDNSVATNWRLSAIVGTPGGENSATADTDSDRMADVWEQLVINASSGSITSVTGVLPGADFDADGLLNEEEFLLGTSPVTPDDQLADLAIALSNGAVRVGFGTQAATGAAYDLFSARLYTLQESTDLVAAGWNGVTNFINLAGDGNTLVYSNAAPQDQQHYRYDIRLPYKRP
jgi:hypothetical protein